MRATPRSLVFVRCHVRPRPLQFLCGKRHPGPACILLRDSATHADLSVHLVVARWPADGATWRVELRRPTDIRHAMMAAIARGIVFGACEELFA